MRRLSLSLILTLAAVLILGAAGFVYVLRQSSAAPAGTVADETLDSALASSDPLAGRRTGTLEPGQGGAVTQEDEGTAKESGFLSDIFSLILSDTPPKREVVFVSKPEPVADPKPAQSAPTKPGTPVVKPVTPSLPPLVVPTGSSAISQTEAWAVFDKYKQYVQAHNLAGINSVSYQPFPCSDPNICNVAIGVLAGVLPQINRSDFVNFWSDGKQAILSTNPSLGVNMYIKLSLYFARGSDGTAKFISMKAEGRGLSEARFKDSDSDGLDDRDETCAAGAPAGCVPTNPNKRDTDGDGWWDGVEVEMRR